MKDARAYLAEFDPDRERLEALVDRVQRDAFAAGRHSAMAQLFEIADAAKVRTDRRTSAVMSFTPLAQRSS